MNHLLTLLILIIIAPLTAQDIIVFRNGEEKEAIVKKVGVSTIEYVRYDNQEGAVYEVLKKEVKQIEFQNGVIERFENGISNPEQIEKIPEGIFIDNRDGQQYKWVKFGRDIWMVDNLNFNDSISPCADRKNDSLCGGCGRYYSWEDAFEACPEGWHLPTDDEWIDLEVTLGMNRDRAVKAGWRGNSGGQAPDMLEGGNSGLDLIKCGFIRQLNHSKKRPKFTSAMTGKEALYWTDTEYDYNQAYIRHLTGYLSVERRIEYKFIRMPIRCVKDPETKN